MTPLLPTKDVELVRSLGKAAHVLILLSMLDRPVGENDIAGILDLYPTTVRNYLRSLEHLGVATRISRYRGWTLTCEGRQMILGRSWINENGSKGAEEEEIEGVEGKIKTNVKNSRSNGEIKTSVKNSRTSVKISRSNGKKSRSRPLAAASLSLSLKEEDKEAAEAKMRASVKNSPSSVKISRSLIGRGHRLTKKENSAGPSPSQPGPSVQANLDAFASIGLARNEFISEICEMDHVSPDYILGQKKRLQAERRYSPGLLLTVIRSKDYLAVKYINPAEQEFELNDAEEEFEEQTEVEHQIEVEQDPSVFEQLPGSKMTPARAWADVLKQLKVGIPKISYERWVKDLVLLSARDGVFVVEAQSGYARNWLEERLSSTTRRLLAGICNQNVEVKFVDLGESTG
jgi:hypothetical protein